MEGEEPGASPGKWETAALLSAFEDVARPSKTSRDCQRGHSLAGWASLCSRNGSHDAGAKNRRVPDLFTEIDSQYRRSRVRRPRAPHDGTMRPSTCVSRQLCRWFRSTRYPTMSSSAPYTITACMIQGSRSTLYRAIRNADRLPRGPQGARSAAQPPEGPRAAEERVRDRQAARLRGRRQAARPRDLPGHARPRPRGLRRPVPRASCSAAPMAVERFLPLAIAIARAVADIHQRASSTGTSSPTTSSSTPPPAR